jgi:hypothetical protein
MIYLAIRVARNSATAAMGLSQLGESDQFWLHPSEDSDDQTQLPEAQFDTNRVRWFRSARISYILRDP